VEHLRKTRVRWIHGYPSFLGLLSQLAIDAGLAGTTDVKWVTVSSENLLDSQRRAIVKMFGVQPRQQYGSTESVAMISECPEGKLHVDEDYSWVELEPIAGDPGRSRIIGSTIDNPAFPLLRYDVGDIVELAAGPCSCGRSGRVVSSIDGRKEDFLVLADGSRIGRVSRIFMGAVNVVEAQIVQREQGEAVIRIVRGPGYGPADDAALRREIADRFGSRLRVELEHVDALPRTRSGKLRLVVSELPEARIASR
jgi:phenylacetate-CoA ligase